MVLNGVGKVQYEFTGNMCHRPIGSGGEEELQLPTGVQHGAICFLQLFWVGKCQAVPAAQCAAAVTVRQRPGPCMDDQMPEGCSLTP